MMARRRHYQAHRQRVQNLRGAGRVASGGALAPKPPRATRMQPESIRTVNLVQNHLFFDFFGFSQTNREEREWGNKIKKERKVDSQTGWMGILCKFGKNIRLKKVKKTFF